MGDADACQRHRARARDRALLALLLVGLARSLGEFLDHLLGQAGRGCGPGIRQQVDEQPFRGHHRVDRHLAAERNPHRHAVRIAAGGAHIARCVGRQPVDGGAHLGLEADHQDAVRHADVGVDLLGKAEHDAGIAAAGIDRDVGLDRLGQRGPYPCQDEEKQGLQQDRNRPQPAPRGCARAMMRDCGGSGVRFVGHDAYCAGFPGAQTRQRAYDATLGLCV
jgi:hypothetical protein